MFACHLDVDSMRPGGEVISWFNCSLIKALRELLKTMQISLVLSDIIEK